MTQDFESLLADAMRRHQSGDLRGAEAAYQQALAEDPSHGTARALLGTCLLQLGRAADAAALLETLTVDFPGAYDSLNNLGVAYQALGQAEPAVRAFHSALKANPEYSQASYNLGRLLLQMGRHAEAENQFRRVLVRHPDDIESHCQLGGCYKSLGRWDAAEHHYRHVLASQPRHREARINLGFVLVQQNRFRDAEELFRAILVDEPRLAPLWSNLSYVLERQGRYGDAEAAARQSLALDPRDADAWNNLAMALRSLGRIDESCDAWSKALQSRADFPLAEFNLACTHLLRGDFSSGWPGYEKRFDLQDRPPKQFAIPRWDGSDLRSRTILLHCEQGLGDTLQFVRYASLVQARGGRVVFQCQPPLQSLLSRVAGIDQLVIEGEPLPPVDLQAPLLSLPGLMATRVESVPNAVPYLHPKPELVELWRHRLESVGPRRVGIHWQGNRRYPRDEMRSIPLIEFEPLSRVTGVALLSLQKGDGLEQLEPARQRFPILVLPDEIDGASGPFEDTAAILCNLDLLITSDTSLAHLAGGLGVPAWVALPHVPDWRWMLARPDSPWYPKMRLFRQPEPGDWSKVFEEMASVLAATDFPLAPGSVEKRGRG